MTNQIFVLSASSLEAASSLNINRDKSFLWSRFHQDYQHNPNQQLKTQSSAGSEDTEDTEETKEDTEDLEETKDTEDREDIEREENASDDQEENESEQGHDQDVSEEEEDIFTKSLAPEHLDLKNFLTVADRKKKISQISEIIAYNFDTQKQVRIKK